MDMAQMLKIRTWPDPVLREVCRSVRDEDRVLVSELSLRMMDVLAHTPIGIGLSAPQVGEPLRMFVMRTSRIRGESHRIEQGMVEHNGGSYFVAVNPSIVAIDAERSETRFEGCLSLPGIEVDVRRPARVEIEYGTVSNGEAHARVRLEGTYARCAMHEIDHLEGVLITDHASKATLRRLGAKCRIPPHVEPVRRTVGAIVGEERTPTPGKSPLLRAAMFAAASIGH